MAILYTQAQVENAQLRAQIAMYLISESTENGFYYFGSPVYQTYKNLQYDIYTLNNVIGNEIGFVSFSSNPTTYEYQFYELVGAMMNKTKQFDVYGEFDGSLNPNYQPPAGNVINIVIPPQIYNSDLILFSGQTVVTLTNYQTEYKPFYGDLPTVTIFIAVGDGTYAQDEETAPIYTYVTPGVPSSGISTITWTYPIPTNGHVQISGYVNS